MKDQINTIRESLDTTSLGIEDCVATQKALAALDQLEAMVGAQEPIGTAISYRDGDGQTRWSFVPKDLAWTVKQNQKAIERGVTRCFDVFAAPPAQHAAIQRKDALLRQALGALSDFDYDKRVTAVRAITKELQ